jgi:hypothetical protein
MQAVVYESPNVVKVVQKQIPQAGPGEAVVKVRSRREEVSYSRLGTETYLIYVRFGVGDY